MCANESILVIEWTYTTKMLSNHLKKINNGIKASLHNCSCSLFSLNLSYEAQYTIYSTGFVEYVALLGQHFTKLNLLRIYC